MRRARDVRSHERRSRWPPTPRRRFMDPPNIHAPPWRLLIDESSPYRPVDPSPSPPPHRRPAETHRHAGFLDVERAARPSDAVSPRGSRGAIVDTSGPRSFRQLPAGPSGQQVVRIPRRACRPPGRGNRTWTAWPGAVLRPDARVLRLLTGPDAHGTECPRGRGCTCSRTEISPSRLPVSRPALTRTEQCPLIAASCSRVRDVRKSSDLKR
jgi:hypothetical protein